MSSWHQNLVELITRTSTDLPQDVEDCLRRARDSEKPESNARATFDMILDNVALARDLRRPICQDTGTIMVWVSAPPSLRQSEFRQMFERAVVEATDIGVLRQNCVDSLTGKNSGNNLGAGHPVIHWHEAEGDTVTVQLVLKGGGCENVGTQYALPDTGLDAGRDLEGVRRCILHAVHQAQGKGCAPGILGVIVGGDRSTGYMASKELFLRRIGERNPVPELAELEERTLAEANSLGIGPMGFGGNTAVLDVFIDTRHRLPASYFVTVSYMCWAYRRRGFTATPDGAVTSWLGVTRA
jgi:fumarate hydratase class I